MADKSIGEVDITLNGKVRTLQCSLAAAKRVNAAANGGIQTMIARVGVMDLDAYVSVIAAGLDVPTQKIETHVYNAGMPALTGSVTEFLVYLANGGRPIVEDEEAAPEGEA